MTAQGRQGVVVSAEDALDEVCPTCKAIVGVGCRDELGRYPGVPHDSRMRKARGRARRVAMKLRAHQARAASVEG